MATKKDRVKALLAVDPDRSDHAIAEDAGCSHVFVGKTRREASLYRPREVIGRDGVTRRVPGRPKPSSSRNGVHDSAESLLMMLDRWQDRSATGASFLRRQRAKIERGFARLLD